MFNNIYYYIYTIQIYIWEELFIISVISNYPSFKDVDAQFTAVPFTIVSVEVNISFYADLRVHNSDWIMR